jgi:hypothetical protein
MSELLRRGAFALGLNVTSHVKTADVLEVINKLRPQDCGKKLTRIGGSGDGGYLIPDDLEGIDYCFSPGVNTVADFENHMADMGIRSFLADYSVDSPPIMRPEFVFDKRFLGITNNERFMTLEYWKDKYLRDHSGDLLLQMDIEGFEWQVIAKAPDALLSQFRILVIEFHGIHKLFDRFGHLLLSSCFDKLLESFHIVHLHPNNIGGSVKKGSIEVPRIMEFTFLNKRRGAVVKPQLQFPHKEDRDNDPGRAPLNLPKCWYMPT